jgi:hypothetical protein
MHLATPIRPNAYQDDFWQESALNAVSAVR